MTLRIFLIFLAVLVLDGLILPALFGFRDSFLSLIILILPMLYFGTEKRYIFFGMFSAVILETFRGLNFGSLALPFLFTALLICLAQLFFDTRHTYITRFNVGKLVTTSLLTVIFFHIFSMFYGRQVDLVYFRLVPNLVMLIETTILVMFFGLVFDKRNYFNV